VYEEAFNVLQSFKEKNFVIVVWTSRSEKNFMNESKKAYKQLKPYVDYFEFCQGYKYRKYFDQFHWKYNADNDRTIILDNEAQTRVFGFKHVVQVNDKELTSSGGYHLKDYSNYDFSEGNEGATDTDKIDQWSEEKKKFLIDNNKQVIQPYYAYPFKTKVNIIEGSSDWKKIQQIAGLTPPTDPYNSEGEFTDRDFSIIQQANKLLKYGKNRDLFYSPMQYPHPKLEKYKVEIGRLYAEIRDTKNKKYRNAMEVGLNELKRYMRTLVLPEDAQELDFKSAHQAIIKSIAEQVNTKESKGVADTMKQYMENKKQHMKDVVDATGCTEEDAKTLFLTLTFGGSIRKWIENIGHINCLYDADKAKYGFPTKFVKSYYTAMRTVEKVFKTHSSTSYLYSIAEGLAQFNGKENPPISAIGYVCQTIEREIAQFVMDYISKNHNAPPQGYAYDGVFYKDTDLKCINFQHLQQKIQEKFNIDMKLDIKPLDPDNESKEHIETLINRYTPETVSVAKRLLQSEIDNFSPPSDYNTANIISKIVEDRVLIDEHCNFYSINEHGLLDFIANFKDGLHTLQSMFQRRLNTTYTSCERDIQYRIRQLRQRKDEDKKENEKQWDELISKEEAKQKLLKQYKTKWETHQFLQNSIKSLTNLEDVKCSNLDKVLDRNNRYMGFNNGVLDLKTFDFYEYCPQGVYICRRCNYDYKPLSEVSQENYQWAHKLIDGLQGSKEEADALKRYLGMAGLRGAINGYRYIGLMIGCGSNGKGLINNFIIPQVIPEHNEGMDVSSFEPSKNEKDRANPDMLALKYNRYVVVDESSTVKLNVNTLKKISGQDTLQARNLFQNTEKFKSAAQITLCANQIPKYSYTDDGIKERTAPFNFPYRFTDSNKIVNPEFEFPVDTTLPQKITDVGPLPFLHVFLEGLKDFYEKDGIALPEQCNERKETILQEMSPVRAWLNENVIKDAKSSVKRDTLIDAISNDNDAIPEDCKRPDGSCNQSQLTKKLGEEMNNLFNSTLSRKREKGSSKRVSVFERVRLLQDNEEVYGADGPDMPPINQKKKQASKESIPEYEPRYEPAYPGTTLDDSKSDDTANEGAADDSKSDDSAAEPNDSKSNKTPREIADANLPEWIRKQVSS